WLASIMVMASCVAVLFGDKIRSQSKPFLYLFQLVAAKDPVHEARLHQGARTRQQAGTRPPDRCKMVTFSLFISSDEPTADFVRTKNAKVEAGLNIFFDWLDHFF
ncbi:hypothetical protein VCX68_15680, partial [Aeromonas caviae]|uniref:hypothetical protein n=1 Tax=Aeromonas caviae TaxID=648 RepID=UPI002B249239